MRTYRGLLIAGVVLWLVGGAITGFDSGVAWLGQLLAVIGAAGLVMVFVVRAVMKRRLRPPGDPGGEA